MVLSVAEISHRLSQVREGEAHLRTELPVDSPHNAILRLTDITRYIGVRPNEVFLWFPEMTRVTHRLRDRPPPTKAQTLPPERQRDFSRFFHGWDAGTLIKARVGEQWRLVGRYESGMAPLAPEARAQARSRTLTMTIDPATLGLRFVK
jgi:hypothetical protein